MGRAASSSSSSIESTNNYFPLSAGSSFPNRDLSTDLRLGLGINSSSQQENYPSFQRDENYQDWPQMQPFLGQALGEEENECNSATFFVKVYMEGIPIGRKLDLLAHDGYHDLIRTLGHMFRTNILWAEADMEGVQYEKCHVLTYEDKEGDWMMVGDVPWEMFLSAVRRLKISKC